jgi:hypothetical protein
MRRKTILRLNLMVSLGLAMLSVTAAERLRVGWYTGGFRLAKDPVFQTKGVQTGGTVDLMLELSPDGAVKQVKTANGPPELRSMVVENAKNWRFVQVPELPATLRVYVYFTVDGGTGTLTPPAPAPPPFGQTLGSLEIEGVSDEVRQQLVKAIGLQAGSILTADSFRRASMEVRKIDPKLVLTMSSHDGKPKIRIAPR